MMDILALLEADDCQFLSSKAHLDAFAKKICCTESVANVSDGTQKDALTVFEILTKLSQRIYDELETFLADATDTNNAEYILSVDESLKVTKLLKYVCAFFIQPYLELTFNNHVSRKIPISNSLSVREKLNLLLENVMNICGLSEKNTIFMSIVMKSCSLYLLTSLLQLCFSPTSARNFDIQKRKSCLKFLNLLTTSWLAKDRLIKDAIAIQNTAHKNSKSCSWLVEKCGSILTKILLGKNGIELIIITMVSNFNDNPEEASESWERVVALSWIISRLPSSAITAEDYCRLVCPQLQNLLISSRQNATAQSKEVIRVAATTLHTLHEKYPAESKLFKEHLCHPLLACEEGCYYETGRDVWVELVQCIETLHQICVSVDIAPASFVSMLLEPYVKILLFLLVKIPGSSYLQSQISDLFYTLFKKSDDKRSVDTILTIFCPTANVKTPNKKLNLTINDDGNITPIYLDRSDPSVLLQDLDRKVEILFDIITKHKSLPGDVFLRLIKKLCDPSKNIPQQIHPNKILSPAERAIESMDLNEERFITFGLLTTLLSECDPNILLHNNRQVLEFVDRTICDLPSKFNENVAESLETLKMCTSVVGICMLSNLDSTQKRSLCHLVPGLKQILDLDDVLDDETKDLVSDLIIAISTYGAVNNVTPPDFSQSMNKCLQDLASLSSTDQNIPKQDIVKVDNGDTSNPIESCEASGKQHQDTLKDDGKFASHEDIDKSISEALKDIHSTLPALKGGSIRYLTKCLNNNIPSAISQIKVLTELFLECMEDDDSFVYLSAVQGLAVISTCGKYFERNALLERILKEFLNDEKLKSVNGVAFKMKLGEVITRVIRDVGDMAPSHASVLLPMFLKLSRHSDSTMRASAMSNFAELAPMAPSMLIPLQFEICDCLCGISVSDADVMVRRAAVYAIRSIVSKLSYQILKIFPETIKSIYDVLKKLYRFDNDNTVQLHAQLALEELDKIMRSTIFKPQQLSKKITVLP